MYSNAHNFKIMRTISFFSPEEKELLKTMVNLEPFTPAYRSKMYEFKKKFPLRSKGSIYCKISELRKIEKKSSTTDLEKTVATMTKNEISIPIKSFRIENNHIIITY